MKKLVFFSFLSFLFTPSSAFAWGPLTHMYLGSELLSLGALLPPAVLAIIRKYKSDFLYGNLMADIIIGKKFLPADKNPHSWEIGKGLLDAAKTQQQKAFVFGFLCHLAADTVAHGIYTRNRRNLGHTLDEMRADSLIDRKYWFEVIRMDRKVQARNDLFLERSLERMIFSFRTNKRIFRGMLLLSCINKEKFGDFIQRNALDPTRLSRKTIDRLHRESLERMADILRRGKSSSVMLENPMVISRRSVFRLAS